MSGNNAVQIEVLLYALTATNVSVQLQGSNDMVNWDNKGSAQTITAIGRKILTSDTAVATTYVRVKFTITGSGKAIFRATLHASQQ